MTFFNLVRINGSTYIVEGYGIVIVFVYDDCGQIKETYYPEYFLLNLCLSMKYSQQAALSYGISVVMLILSFLSVHPIMNIQLHCFSLCIPSQSETLTVPSNSWLSCPTRFSSNMSSFLCLFPSCFAYCDFYDLLITSLFNP